MNNNENTYAIDMSNVKCGAHRENAYTPETYRAEMEKRQNAILNDLTVYFPSEQQIFQDDEPTSRWPIQRSYHDEDEVPMLMARIQALERENEELVLSNERLERINEQLMDEALHNALMYGPLEQQQEQEQMDIEEEGEIIEPPVLERQSNGTPPLQPMNLFIDFDLEEEVEDDDDDSISSSSYGSMPSLVTIQEEDEDEDDDDDDDDDEQIVYVPPVGLSVSIPQNEYGQDTWRLVESSVSDDEELHRPTKRARQEVL